MTDKEILDDMQAGHPGKQRHGCVTAWLIFMLIANALGALVYFFWWDSMMSNMPEEALADMPDVNPYIIGGLSVLNAIFAFLMLKWKKTGFWGVLVTSVLAMFYNIQAGLGITSIIGSIVSIAILYAILQIKEGGKSAWENME